MSVGGGDAQSQNPPSTQLQTQSTNSAFDDNSNNLSLPMNLPGKLSSLGKVKIKSLIMVELVFLIPKVLITELGLGF